MEFTRASIVEAFGEIGEALFRRRKIADITVFGGCAMILLYDVAFVTQDLDVLIGSEHGEVTAVVQTIARRRGWASTWLNEGVSVYLSPDAHDQVARYGSFPDESRVGLRVYVAKPEYLLALKLRALRVGSRDFEDVMLLARALKLRSLEELLQVVARHFPNQPLDSRKRLALAGVVEALG